VLARIAGTLGGKGYNIDSLCVDVTMNPEISKIILTTRASKIMIGRVINALSKLVDVVRVENLSEVESIKREMILIRMNLMKETKPELMKTIDTLNCKILTFNTDHCVLQFTGSRRTSTRCWQLSNRWASTISPEPVPRRWNANTK